VLAHHEDLRDEWEGKTGSCFRQLRDLVDWEPED
jgi:hypothetical protein